MTIRLKRKLDDKTEELMSAIIGCAIEVHKELGQGYLEKVYENAMSAEMRMQNIKHKTQVPVSVLYKGVKVQGQVLDMVVEDKIILELKAVSELVSAHEAQLLSYLKSTGMRAGLLINFRENLVKDGIRRFVNL